MGRGIRDLGSTTAGRAARGLATAVASLLLVAAAADADVPILHLGLEDPATEGFTATGPGTGVTTAAILDDVPDVDAWEIDDASAAAGSSLYYSATPSAGTLADASVRGFLFTVRVRVDDFPDLAPTGGSIEAFYDDGVRRYSMRFYADVAGLPSVVLGDDVALEPRVDLVEDGYHAYQLRLHPTDGFAKLFIDGDFSASNYDGEPSGGVPEIGFGSLDDADVGSGRFNLVAFEVPDPPPACRDGIDNDSDGLVDYPADTGCRDEDSELEDPRCDDDLDNDGDGLADWDGAGMGAPDPECVGRPWRFVESVTQRLWCLGPDAQIFLRDPNGLLDTEVVVDSTCIFDSTVFQTSPQPAEVFARLHGIPGGQALESRHEHLIDFGVLEGEDDLQTDLSPLMTFGVPQGIQPTQRILVTSRLEKSGSFGFFSAEAQVQGIGFDQTCVFTGGEESCPLDVPSGAAYSIEPALRTENFMASGRAELVVAVEHVPACRDGQDNDGDLLVDFPADPECFSPDDQEETDNQCGDGIDNDGDGLIDLAEDPGCSGFTDLSELNPAVECDDGIDNDGDLLIDFPNDPECISAVQLSESAGCADGLDNDNDGLIDFPADPGCADALDNNERGPGRECDDEIDNDSDGKTDYPDDPHCANAFDMTEKKGTTGIPTCGLGAELGLLLGILGVARRRRR